MTSHDNSNRRGVWPPLPPTEQELQGEETRARWLTVILAVICMVGLAMVAGLICWRMNGGRFS